MNFHFSHLIHVKSIFHHFIVKILKAFQHFFDTFHSKFAQNCRYKDTKAEENFLSKQCPIKVIMNVFDTESDRLFVRFT